MAPNAPSAGQSEEAAARLEAGVSAESLRDTRGGSPEPHIGALFAYQGGSRPLEGYTIKRGVGRGGFGEVYYATSDAGKEVALKLVRRNFEIELRGMTQCLNLKHPNLISLYDIRQDAHEANWVVMEFVSGESLEQIIDRHPNGMSIDQAVECFRHMCSGVAYLHDRGIVHRDLKPGNIFLDEGTYKIGDYGLSKFISHSRRSGQTESIGTVHYMAPEIANGRYGKEIDTYALGVILYEMLTGQVPYEGESIGEVLMKHLTAEPDLNKVPLPFRPIVARLLRKDPDQRYASVAALLEDVDAVMSGKSPSAASLSVKSPPLPSAGPIPTAAPQAGPRRLKASSKDQVFSGVLAGFANYFGIDPVWMRLAFVIVTILTGFIPVIIYFVLAMIMPSDEEDFSAPEPAPVAQAPTPPFIDPATIRAISMDLVRVFVSILFSVGVGCLAGGTAVMLMGWHNDAVYWIGPASGLLTASISIAVLCRSGHAIFRTLAVLMFGAAVGMGTAALTLFLVPSYHDEEIAAFFGTGAGFATIALGLIWSFHRNTYLLWRVGASLFTGLGAGLSTAGLVILLSNSEDAAAFLGVGTGFVLAGLTAFVLFFGFLSPARQHRRTEAMRATQVWSDSGQVAEQPAGSKVPRGLIVAAVVLGLIPAALFLLFRARAGEQFYIPARGFTLGHRCMSPNCSQQATVLFSKEGFVDGQFQQFEYCNAHARANAYEARQANRKYGVFDIDTGMQRLEFNDVGTFRN